MRTRAWGSGKEKVVERRQVAASGTPGTPAETLYAADRASQALGIELLEHGSGFAVARMTVAPWMVNGHAIAHGGYVFLLADSAFAFACNDTEEVTVASGADITFIAPVRAGDELVAHARAVRRYGRSGLYDVSVRCGEDVVSEFRGRSRTLDRKERA